MLSACSEKVEVRVIARPMSVMLLPVCRSSSLGDANFVAFTGKPLEHSVFLIYSNQ